MSEDLHPEFKKGTQIAYIPMHVLDHDVDHPDVEFGFVMRMHRNGRAAWCRYWGKCNAYLGQRLRTVSNSELTPVDRLLVVESVPQILVDIAIRQIEEVS